MTAVKIEEHSLSKLNIEDLKFDDSNPNFMKEQQMEGLRESMKEFGFLDPVIVDQDNLIADGEHRVLIYKEFGKKTIDGYKMELSDEKRRLLRQVMNKLRGQHEPSKDYSEIVKLMEHTPNKELMDLLSINKTGLS